tara:strand:- start:492 stop:674 length:183 start_codon:yes stop_codon:yes gene_type:complete
MKQYKQLNPYSIRTQDKLLRRVKGAYSSDSNEIRKSEDRKKAMKKKRKLAKKMRQKNRSR